MRIDKLLSNLKYGTRNEIKKAMKLGLATVNGEIVKDPKTNVNPEIDKVVFMEEEIYYKETILIMLNKPKGYVCANRDGLHKTVFELIEAPYDRFDLNIAGRLDIDTEGLILLTNSGEILHNIITPHKNVYKTYLVKVDKPFDAKKLLNKISILDGKSMPYEPMTPKVEQINDFEFHLSIREGKFHQVKRMCKHFNREVLNLKRISIGEHILSDDLKLGEYKEI